MQFSVFIERMTLNTVHRTETMEVRMGGGKTAKYQAAPFYYWA